MKVFEVELGGKRRQLRYTPADGVALWKRFNRPLTKLLLEDCLGLRDGKPTTDFNPEAQLAVLAVGLKSEDATVGKWLEQAQYGKPEVSIGDFLGVAVKAAFYSGIVNGRSIDLDEIKTAAEDDEGKAQEPATAV